MPDIVVKCPHCGKAVDWISASQYKPFCSERCQLIDLGDWLLERHVISGVSTAQEADQPGQLHDP